MVDPRDTPLYDLGGLEQWQSFEPKAGGFNLSVTKLPRLDDLIRLAPTRRHYANGIFDGYSLNRSLCQIHEETNGISLFPLFVLEPSGP